MKTFIKILVLVLCVVGAISGILVFEKTRVAPPSSIQLVDQYSRQLESVWAGFEKLNDFKETKRTFRILDDRISRFYKENAIDSKMADDYHARICGKYGKELVSHGFDLLKEPVWFDGELNEVQEEMCSLSNERLLSGKLAWTGASVKSADKFVLIMNDYGKAQRLSLDYSFNGLEEAASKIETANGYVSHEYLSNNQSLVEDLKLLPERIAESHYSQLTSMVGRLNSYRSHSKNDYLNEVIPPVDNAIKEYKNTNVYGSSKPDVAALESKAVEIITAAMRYYSN